MELLIKISLRYINNLTELPGNTTLEGLLFWDTNRTGGRPPQNHKAPNLICEKQIIDVKEIVHNAEIALHIKKVNLKLKGSCRFSCYTPCHGAEERGESD